MRTDPPVRNTKKQEPSILLQTTARIDALFAPFLDRARVTHAVQQCSSSNMRINCTCSASVQHFVDILYMMHQCISAALHRHITHNASVQHFIDILYMMHQCISAAGALLQWRNPAMLLWWNDTMLHCCIGALCVDRPIRL